MQWPPSYNVCRLCSLHSICIKQLRNYPGSAPYLATAFATCATGNAATKLSFCYIFKCIYSLDIVLHSYVTALYLVTAIALINLTNNINLEVCKVCTQSTLTKQ